MNTYLRTQKIHTRTVTLALSLFVGLGFILQLGIPAARSEEYTTQTSKRPNIVFVMTDDQPIKDTMVAMPKIRERVRDRGMALPNSYVSQSLCCPSRASILRSQYPHNTGVMRNGPPDGGVQTFRATGQEDNIVAHWLQRQGYSTALIGKYMNGYDASYKPPGWSYWYAKADASTSGQKANENGHVINFAGVPGNWGDRFKKKTIGYLDRKTDQASDGPFALFFWTGQPHLQANDYAERYAKMYPHVSLDLKPSFDEGDVSDKPAWVRNLGRIGDHDRDQLEQWRRNQLRSVRQVDDTVGAMLDLLKKRGELDNTYVVFTTDNSTHMGEHRWFGDHGAKDTAYEEAANVPMFVRGPGIRAGSTSSELVLNNDLAPTFVQIAGGTPPSFVDGRSLLPVWRGNNPTWRTAIMNERPIRDINSIPPYHALITQRYTYVEYETGEKELYDRKDDPYELRSKHDGIAYADTTAAFSLRLRALEACEADTCRTAENDPPLAGQISTPEP
jgi:N-acetylglucosamine-6-sulfatase